MINYTISCSNPLSQLITVKTTWNAEKGFSDLHLPAWRPGRYEFQHYARNVINFSVYGENGMLNWKKTARNTWRFETELAGQVTVSYSYSCTQLDAGGSWLDDVLCYINPINCLMYLSGKEQEPCSLSLDLPFTSVPASGLQFNDHMALIENYFQLADSPFFLSQQLTHEVFEVEAIDFHLWIHGDMHVDMDKLINDFRNFCTVQLAAMGGFPEKSYHFLLLFLPFQHYHGVEHHTSTVITLGPAHELSTPELYEELISISSHELFHAWNICKIRPEEMYPYRFGEENYFRTGFVAEGITTYLGEYFLRQSGFFSEERFLLEIEQWLQRHQQHRGLERTSLLDSSFDLWVDGYISTSADFKLSIYVAGALSAIALDLQIRLHSPGKSLLDFMSRLYQEKALKQEGYSETYLYELLGEYIGEARTHFWEQCLKGNAADVYLCDLLPAFGLKTETTPASWLHESSYGILLKPGKGKLEISKLRMGSPASSSLMPDDLITHVNGNAVSSRDDLQTILQQFPVITLDLSRKGRKIMAELSPNDISYWNRMQVQKNSEASAEEKLRYVNWLGSVND